MSNVSPWMHAIVRLPSSQLLNVCNIILSSEEFAKVQTQDCKCYFDPRDGPIFCKPPNCYDHGM